MKHSTSYAALSLAFCLCPAASTAMGAFGSMFRSPVGSDPIWNQATSTWSWGGWESFAIGEESATIVIPGNGGIYLGLENLYDADKWKEVTLEYVKDSTSGSISVLLTWANYAPAGSTPATGSWTSVTAPVNYEGDKWRITGKMDPQPSWELIRLRNDSGSATTITITKFSSSCVPAPGAIAVLGLAAVVGWRRRRH